VIRDEIPLHAVPYFFMAAPHTGYVRLQDFNETTACRVGDGKGCEKELEKALRLLREQGASSMILDIRDNPGGLLDQAIAVSNLFLAKGQLVVYTRGRTKRDESNYITETESPYADLPLLVLTSQHSASASEIVAGAIQDHDRGLIVGETTFGKGLVQTIMPLRNVRGYALALTTARYYTPSGRSIQRDYGSTAFEDYVAPRDRKTCESGGGEVKLTDAGRKVFGGDGITPDYCVEPPSPDKFVASLIARQAFVGFARRYEASESAVPASIAGTGSRSELPSAGIRRIGRDFRVDASVLAEFKDYLKAEKIPFSDADLEQNQETVTQDITEVVLTQVFGEGEARKRSLAWDPQVQKALALVGKAETLLHDPQRFIAERQAESRVASTARP
jgi:carboxyl-terminal processing protease